MKAHQLQVKVAELTQVDQDRYYQEKEMKLKKEVEKVKMKHDNEINAMNLKVNAAFGEFKKNRAVEFDKYLFS